jgi:N-acetylglucosamine-6-phosphate deacetylase
VARYQEAAGGHILLWTFAPEEGEAMAAIPALLARGIVPVIGHSDATTSRRWRPSAGASGR